MDAEPLPTVLPLPAALEHAIAAALRTVPASQWLSAARALSERYRDERAGPERALARGTPAALGYAALILPAAYAQLRGAMAATRARVPDWQPHTLLDLGSGPGTALWAAVETWPAIQTVTAWEREPAFIALGRQLAQASSHPAVAAARWEQVTLDGPLPAPTPRYDLIVLGHLLNELAAPVRHALVAAAWAQCAGVLLIVEPGTSAAFALVREAREQLLARGAHTLAPCAHDQACPLAGDWCHFPQRLQRPAFQRRAKDATAGWEESKFAYAALGRVAASAPIWGRLIHQPQRHKGGVELIVSSREGLVRPFIPHRDRARYRAASALRWGSALATPPAADLAPPTPPAPGADGAGD
ncbi:MAG TPA: small ribosomal subunit Rsm22 family protein [Chloroflexia bacterium]|nr:small ribosomal subunit Rsm22 family protein [Chloroflexia bacterium]